MLKISDPAKVTVCGGPVEDRDWVGQDDYPLPPPWEPSTDHEECVRVARAAKRKALEEGVGEDRATRVYWRAYEERQRSITEGEERDRVRWGEISLRRKSSIPPNLGR